MATMAIEKALVTEFEQHITSSNSSKGPESLVSTNLPSSEDQSSYEVVSDFLDRGIQLAVPNTCLGEVEVGESHRENYEVELIDIEITPVVSERRPCRKKTWVYNMEPLFLMKGKGRSFVTLRFNQN